MGPERSPSSPGGDAAPVAGEAVSDAIRAREHGLALLRRANRWLVGLAVLLAGALTGVTAHAFHASPASARTPPATGQGSAGTVGSGGAVGSNDDNTGAGTGSSSVQPPSSAPAPATPAPAPVAPVVSGGS